MHNLDLTFVGISIYKLEKTPSRNGRRFKI